MLGKGLCIHWQPWHWGTAICKDRCARRQRLIDIAGVVVSILHINILLLGFVIVLDSLYILPSDLNFPLSSYRGKRFCFLCNRPSAETQSQLHSPHIISSLPQHLGVPQPRLRLGGTSTTVATKLSLALRSCSTRTLPGITLPTKSSTRRHKSRSHRSTMRPSGTSSSS